MRMFKFRYIKKYILSIHKKSVIKLRDHIIFRMKFNFESRRWQRIMRLTSFYLSVVKESDPRQRSCTRR
eukprot:10344314-Prorocentrum_lima.AAC.1